ncbi:MAG: polysaccharide deacetylase family protein [Minisyncoccia bacterium]
MIYSSFGNRKEKKIALTFDDGPNPPITNQVLDILKDYNVKGNFFLLGNYAKENEATVKEIYRRGHLIGVHGYHHEKGVNPEFEIAAEIIERITKEKPIFYRPPYGDLKLCLFSNYFQLNPQLKIILFDVDSLDYKSKKEEIIEKVLKETQNGSIIDFHDSSQHLKEKKTRPLEMLKALPEIILKLKEKGFLILRLDEMDLIFKEFKN